MENDPVFRVLESGLALLELLTSLDVIELRLGGGIILWRRGGFGTNPRLNGGSEQRAGLVGANWLLLDPGLNLTAALGPKTATAKCHPELLKGLNDLWHIFF